MLSYQHIYHAGNQADVHKHRILVEILLNLTRTDAAITYFETHAGRGIYDLSSFEAQKTGEYVEGIKRILAKEASNNDSYLELIKQVKENYGPSFYPGSPLIAQMILRDYDDIFLMELHPGEFKHLFKLANNTSKTTIYKRDGYKGVLSLSPPKHKKGIILIDPSYELKSEYGKIVEFIKILKAEWSESVIMIWYPILPENYHTQMVKDIKALNLNNLLISEILFEPQPKKGMLGSGVIIINAPAEFLI